MSDPLWPGDHRAGAIFTPAAFFDAMVGVESAWLVAQGHQVDLSGLVTQADHEALAVASEAGGNPVIPLVDLLRVRLVEQPPEGASVEIIRALHQGLTSQDVLDSALMVCARNAAGAVVDELDDQIRRLDELAEAHHGTPMIGRTLTQSALPITFGHKVRTWLAGLTVARDRLRGLHRFPAQCGGPVGTGPPSAGRAGANAPSVETVFAERLGLAPVDPWHTERSAVTGVGDALVTTSDAWGRIANDVALLGRPEIGELHEAKGGGSSSMPHKQNPVLSILVRRHAIAAPQLAATLHAAAAGFVDERPDGAWHVEWSTLATLARRSVVAARQTTELLDGLVVDVEAMRRNLDRAEETLA